jgi:hypothetical protein
MRRTGHWQSLCLDALSFRVSAPVGEAQCPMPKRCNDPVLLYLLRIKPTRRHVVSQSQAPGVWLRLKLNRQWRIPAHPGSIRRTGSCERY